MQVSLHTYKQGTEMIFRLKSTVASKYLDDLEPGTFFWRQTIRGGHSLVTYVSFQADAQQRVPFCALDGDDAFAVHYVSLDDAHRLRVVPCYLGELAIDLREPKTATDTYSLGRLHINDAGAHIQMTNTDTMGHRRDAYGNLSDWSTSNQYPADATTFEHWRLMGKLAGTHDLAVVAQAGTWD